MQQLIFVLLISISFGSCTNSDGELSVSFEDKTVKNNTGKTNSDVNSEDSSIDTNSGDTSTNSNSGDTSTNSNSGDTSTNSNSGDTSTNSNSEDTSTSSSSSSSSTNTQTASNEIFIDFSNTTDLTDNFTLNSKSGHTFSQTQTHPYTGTSSAKCTSASGHGGCWQISKQTFNLPISIELDFATTATYYTGSGFSINLYEGVATRDTYYGRVTAGTNLAQFYWSHSYDSNAGYSGKYIKGYEALAEIGLPLTGGSSNLSNYGKMLLEILADGSYTFTYTEYDSNGNYLNEHVDTGTITNGISNFQIELHQKNYSSGKNFYYDNLKITY